jgi:hypothetical protein
MKNPTILSQIYLESGLAYRFKPLNGLNYAIACVYGTYNLILVDINDYRNPKVVS